MATIPRGPWTRGGTSRGRAGVSGTSQRPTLPAVVTGALAIAILIANVGFPNVVKVVTAVAILWANLAYLLVTAPLLLRRFRGWPVQAGLNSEGVFVLGRW